MFDACFRAFLICLVLTMSGTDTEAAKRVALVIGNSAYEKTSKLKNPENDARTLADTLDAIGFDQVTLKLDQTYTQLRRSLSQFSRQAAGADVALIYFAGHGIEVSGTNYVIPVDAGLAHVDDVEFEAVEVSKLLSAMNRAGTLKLVILDACRNNPFKQSMASTGTTRSVGRGLARVNPAGSDTLVAYAAKEGTLADDGTGTNSPYAAALIKHLTTPGLDVRLMFGRVRDEVLAATGRRQEPFTYGSLGGEAIYLAPPEAVSTPAPQATPASPARDREVVFWDSIKSSTVASDFEAYLERFPRGTFVALARSRLARLKAQEAAAEAERKKQSEVAALQVPKKERVLRRVGSREAVTVGTRGRWAVAHYDTDDGIACFAYARPSRSSPRDNKLNTKDIAFLVQTELNRSRKDVVRGVSAFVGTRVRKSEVVMVDIDGKSFAFAGDGHPVFLQEFASEPAFVEAMKAGNRLTVTGRPTSGRSYKDVYSLRGVTKALELLNQICPPGS